jgi:formyltetrahydrofolate deformylase
MIINIQCKDQVGLVAAISSFLSAKSINIISMREHVDTEKHLFFARLEVSGTHSTESIENGLRVLLPSDAEIKAKHLGDKKVIILVTKEHHCLADLLIRHHFQTMGMRVECVIGNHENLGDLCARFNVPFVHVSHEGKSKVAFESEINEVRSRFSHEILVLAKFMRILSPEFIANSQAKIVNIHHSFLPAFVGANPYRHAHARGVKLIGATAHFVTDALDEGPIITQEIIPVDHTHSVEEMKRAGREVEVSVLAKAVRLVAEDRTFVCGNKTVLFE